MSARIRTHKIFIQHRHFLSTRVPQGPQLISQNPLNSVITKREDMFNSDYWSTKVDRKGARSDLARVCLTVLSVYLHYYDLILDSVNNYRRNLILADFKKKEGSQFKVKNLRTNAIMSYSFALQYVK